MVTVSLLTADDSVADGYCWVQRAEAFYHDDVNEQPTGQVGLYHSDVAGLAGLPLAYCRPLAQQHSEHDSAATRDDPAAFYVSILMVTAATFSLGSAFVFRTLPC